MITGTYNLLADPSWAILQLQEVRLECDTTTAPVTINLPEISTLAQSTNLKLFIVDATGNAAANNIIINVGGTDSFDETGNNVLVLDTNGSSVELQNVASTQWLAIESIGGGGSLPSNKGQLVNITNGQTISSPLNRLFTLGETTINPSINFTGSTTETLLTSVLIPANTYKIGDFILNEVMSIKFSCEQGTGGLTINSYFNTTNSLSGATILNTNTYLSTGINEYTFTAGFNPSAPKEVEFITNSQLQSVDFTACPVKYNNFGTFDITQDVYILFTVTLAKAADEISLARLFNNSRVIQSV